MALVVTEHFVQAVRDILADRPLEEGEYRRIKGLGELYVSLLQTSPDGHFLLFECIIDELKLYMHRKISISIADRD